MEIQTIKDNALITLKMLLGIGDDGQDSLLSFLIDDAVNMIFGYCRIEILPRQIESLVPMIAADVYRANNYGDTSPAEDIKSITQGDRSVTLESSRPTTETILRNYYARLNPYVNRRGRVPSEVKTV